MQISHEHLIFSSRPANSVQAQELKLNDSIIILNPNINQIEKGLIIQIEEIYRIGIYAPLTKSGNLIGIVFTYL